MKWNQEHQFVVSSYKLYAARRLTTILHHLAVFRLQVKTTIWFDGVRKGLEMWHIILAILVGVFLLALLIFLLWKVGTLNNFITRSNIVEHLPVFQMTNNVTMMAQAVCYALSACWKPLKERKTVDINLTKHHAVHGIPIFVSAPSRFTHRSAGSLTWLFLMWAHLECVRSSRMDLRYLRII
jgi:hypothetical protein